jgi:hypothetical protein
MCQEKGEGTFIGWDGDMRSLSDAQLGDILALEQPLARQDFVQHAEGPDLRAFVHLFAFGLLWAMYQAPP